jgi:hypothetical protein
MTEQGKTLGQLNVQPGDVVRCVDNYGRPWWTVGKEYHVYESKDGLIIKDDDGDPRRSIPFAFFTIVSRNEVNPSQDGASMITKEQALELLSSIADNPPRVCVAWCGKAQDDCACFKAHVAREAVNGQAEDALQTVIALHERVERLEAALRPQDALLPQIDLTGCKVCGVRGVMGYVCPRPDCPTAVRATP